jgi:hypothetical protein
VTDRRPGGSIVPLDELDHTRHAHESVGDPGPDSFGHPVTEPTSDDPSGRSYLAGSVLNGRRGR